MRINPDVQLWLAGPSSGQFLPRDRYHTAQTAKWFSETISHLNNAHFIAGATNEEYRDMLDKLPRELTKVQKHSAKEGTGSTERQRELLYSWMMDQLLEIDIARFIPHSFASNEQNLLDSISTKKASAKKDALALYKTSNSSQKFDGEVSEYAKQHRAEAFILETITRCEQSTDPFVLIDQLTNLFCVQIDKIRHSCWLYYKVVSVPSKNFDHCAYVLNANMLVCRYIARVILPYLVVQMALKFRSLLAAIKSTRKEPSTSSDDTWGINRRAVLELVYQSHAHISRMKVGLCPPGVDPDLKLDVDEAIRFCLDNLLILRHQLRITTTPADLQTFQPMASEVEAIKALQAHNLRTMVVWNPTAGGHKVPKGHPEQPSRVTAIAHLIQTSTSITGTIEDGVPIVAKEPKDRSASESEGDHKWRIQDFSSVGVFSFAPPRNLIKSVLSHETFMCTHSLKYIKRLWRARQLLEMRRWKDHPACWPVLKPSELAQDKLLDGDDVDAEDDDAEAGVVMGPAADPVAVLVDFDEDHHNETGVPDRCCCCSSTTASETQMAWAAKDKLDISHRGDGLKWNHDEEGRVRKHVQSWYNVAFKDSNKTKRNRSFDASKPKPKPVAAPPESVFGIALPPATARPEPRKREKGRSNLRKVAKAVLKLAESGIDRSKLGDVDMKDAGETEYEVTIEHPWLCRTQGIFTLAETKDAYTKDHPSGLSERMETLLKSGENDQVQLVSLHYLGTLLRIKSMTEEDFLEEVGLPLEMVTAFFVESTSTTFVTGESPLPALVEPARVALVQWVQEVLGTAEAHRTGKHDSVLQRGFVRYLPPKASTAQSCVQEFVPRDRAIELVKTLRAQARPDEEEPAATDAEAIVQQDEVALEYLSEAVDAETELLELYFVEVAIRGHARPIPEYVRRVGERLVTWVRRAEEFATAVQVSPPEESEDSGSEAVSAANGDARSVAESTATGAGSLLTMHGSSKVRPQDTFVSEHSLDVAVHSLELVATTVNAVMLNDHLNMQQRREPAHGQMNAFCVVRPPGHHVGRSGKTANCYSHGFCLLNNVAYGIAHARIRWGIRRVAVVDIDAHFGNGTGEILQHDEDALFASVHLHNQDASASNSFFASDLQGASLICPSTNFYSIGVGPQGRQKRGSRGRSNIAPDMVAINIKPRNKRPHARSARYAAAVADQHSDSDSQPSRPKKRGPGRPPLSDKVRAARAAGRAKGSGKRPVGRPPKVKRPVGRPPGSTKRPVGRPPGSTKRPVGRPPGSTKAKKKAASAAIYAAYATLNPEAIPVKRGPGRPRKVKPEELEAARLLIGAREDLPLAAAEEAGISAVLELSQAVQSDEKPVPRPRGRPRKRELPAVVSPTPAAPAEPPRVTVGELKSAGKVDENEFTRQCDCEKCLLRPPAAHASKLYYGGDGHRDAIRDIVIPALERFDPEMIFISAGFDGHWKDPLGSKLGMEEHHFFEETNMLVNFSKNSTTCRGRIISVLEGGYDVVQKIKNRGASKGFSGALADSAVAHVCALTGVEYET